VTIEFTQFSPYYPVTEGVGEVLGMDEGLGLGVGEGLCIGEGLGLGLGVGEGLGLGEVVQFHDTVVVLIPMKEKEPGKQSSYGTKMDTDCV